jgi:hypothetical protein
LNPRLVAVILAVVLVAYFVVIADKATIFFRDGAPVTVGLGIAALLLPLVGAVLLFFELRFGWRTQQLGRRLGAEGGLPEQPDLPTRPSGRIDKAAALPAGAGRGRTRPGELAGLVPVGRRVRPGR